MSHEQKIVELAVDSLDNAETAILSFLASVERLDEHASEDELPDVMPVLAAVLRSVERTLGLLEALKVVVEVPYSELISPISGDLEAGS